MSSGWNGIGIKGVGKTRRRLADMLCQLTGWLVDPNEIKRTNPSVRHWEDCCSWDCYMVVPATETQPCRKVHVYCWDTMGNCVKSGIGKVTNDQQSNGGTSYSDVEITANGNP